MPRNYVRKYGDWEKAGAVLQTLNANLVPAFSLKVDEQGKIVLNKLLEHIEKQDLNWVPLSPKTIALKGGSETIYVDTGYLRENLNVRRIKSPKNAYTIFIGASPWKRTPKGEKFSNIMLWLEYGTDKIPPRPLIRPTWAEVKPIIQRNLRDFLKEFIQKGGNA